MEHTGTLLFIILIAIAEFVIFIKILYKQKIEIDNLYDENMKLKNENNKLRLKMKVKNGKIKSIKSTKI